MKLRMKIHYYIKLPLEQTTECAEMKSNYRDGNYEDTIEECLTAFLISKKHRIGFTIVILISCLFCEVSWTQEPHMDLFFLHQSMRSKVLPNFLVCIKLKLWINKFSLCNSRTTSLWKYSTNFLFHSMFTVWDGAHICCCFCNQDPETRNTSNKCETKCCCSTEGI